MNEELKQDLAAMNAITQDIASEVLEDVSRAHPVQRPRSLNDPPAPQPQPAPQVQAAQTQAQPVQTQPQGGQPASERRFAGKYLSVELNYDGQLVREIERACPKDGEVHFFGKCGELPTVMELVEAFETILDGKRLAPINWEREGW